MESIARVATKSIYGKQTIMIVAFGDSITQAAHQVPEDRWPEVLKRAIQERFPECSIRVINAGVGGNTSREGVRRLEQDVLAHNPDFVLVEFSNDATPEPERHVSFEEFAANLDLIKTKVEEGGKGRVIMLTFTPIIDRWHSHYNHEFFKRNGGQDAYQENYREMSRQFARTRGVPLADVDRAMRKEIAVHGPAEYILNDGVHLTARGNQVVAEVVLEVLRTEIENFLIRGIGLNGVV